MSADDSEVTGDLRSEIEQMFAEEAQKARKAAHPKMNLTGDKHIDYHNPEYPDDESCFGLPEFLNELFEIKRKKGGKK